MKYVQRDGERIAVNTLNSGGQAAKRKSFKVQFVKLPCYWLQRLERSKSPGTFKLAHRILKEDFKHKLVGGDIVLSSATTGLSRKVRSKAVKELVGLGLIEIEQNGNQAVKVTNLLLEKEERE